jgi:hypothetical protein
MSGLWLKDFAGPGWADAAPPGAHAGSALWQAMDGLSRRAYRVAGVAPGEGWVALAVLQALRGVSAGAAPGFHYVVEADVAPEHEQEFNAWYEQEHLPGLAAVPGTVRAARYRRAQGSPVYLACYDLTSPAVLERPEWLAVRHTEWSARVRPLFRNARRTMFRR